MTYRWAVPYLALGVSIAACQPVAPSSDVFAPARQAAPAAAAAPEAAPSAEAAATPVEGGFDFDAEDRPAEEAAASGTQAPLSPAELFQGLGLGEIPPEAALPEPAPVAAAVVAPQPPGWTGTPAPVSWGVRLVSTVPDAQPPRAILGLADGKEHVVTPGTLLPEARLVVLAIGRDLVQVAEITPQGDHALVATYLLQALYPDKPAQR